MFAMNFAGARLIISIIKEFCEIAVIRGYFSRFMQKIKNRLVFFNIFGKTINSKNMKKIYLSLLLSAAGLVANAQLTQANHAFAGGEIFTTYQCDSTGVTAGASGAGANWNFGSITTHSSMLVGYSVTVNTNTTYPMPGLSLSSTANNSSYYTSDPTDTKYWGGNILVGSIGATLTYTSGAYTAVYPMNLNTSTVSATGGSISVPALSQNGTFTGNAGAIADGTGTLILPTGTYTNVVRVVTTQTINFTTPLANGTVTQKNWDYYSVGTKNSLFTISASTVVTSLAPTPSSQTVVTRSAPTSVGVKENKANLISLSVYPNPSSSQITLATESNKANTVEINDVTGKMISVYVFDNNKVNFSTLEMTNGIYFYTVKNNAKQTIAIGKFTITH